MARADDGLGATARNVTGTEGDVKKGDMHLVVQKGRTFQMENPDARLLLDKGRYLVVEMPRAEARKLAGRTDPCFHIEPLKRNSVVFEERLPVRARCGPPRRGCRTWWRQCSKPRSRPRSHI